MAEAFSWLLEQLVVHRPVSCQALPGTWMVDPVATKCLSVALSFP